VKEMDQLRKGSTPLLILSTLQDEKKYGYQIMRELERRSEGYFSMTAALLYPTLHQMEIDGLVESEWAAGQGKRRRKYYAVTPKGRKALAESQNSWENFFQHLFQILNSAAQAK
jgi:PadR family transcriptional regulator, regulatory protein PadR